MLPYYIVFPSYCGPNFLFYIEVTQRRHHVCVVMIVGKRDSVCRYGKDRSFALRWFWCSCIRGREHIYVGRKSLPLRGSIVPWPRTVRSQTELSTHVTV